MRGCSFALPNRDRSGRDVRPIAASGSRQACGVPEVTAWVADQGWPLARHDPGVSLRLLYLIRARSWPRQGPPRLRQTRRAAHPPYAPGRPARPRRSIWRDPPGVHRDGIGGSRVSELGIGVRAAAMALERGDHAL